MEMSQGTPYVAILNEQKFHFFSFIKSENRRAEQVLSEGFGTRGKGNGVGKRCRG
jgi:hypothetical protein